MVRRTAFFLGFFALAGWFSACTSVLGDFEVDPSLLSEAGTGGEGGGKKGNGVACGAAGECNSNFCVDGLCCESACSGTCETCNGAEKGKCAPVPDGQDPDKECAPQALPDAGAPTTGTELDGGEDGGGSEDGGTTINLPDGGLTAAAETVCGGSCNGNRACKYPGQETSCGTQFCNTAVESAGLRCDGKGHCDLGFSACGGFTCEGEACQKSCVDTSDCDSAHFCRENKCEDRRGNGQECNIGTQCLSGFCVDGVCCNTDCSLFPGGNCKKAGFEGKCQCGIDCGTRACRFFYKDADGDKHGDKNARPGLPGTTATGCEGDPPPATFSDKNDDCDDQDLRAFPGQTQYFDTPRTGVGGYDFNCDDKEVKQTPEYIDATCRFCKPPTQIERYACVVSSPTACYYAKQPATLDCDLSRNTSTCLAIPGDKSSCYVCDGTGNRNGNPLKKGFRAEVPCGGKAALTECGACTAAGGLPTAPTTTPNTPQRCR